MASENGLRRFPAEWEKHEATWIFWPTKAEAYLYGSVSDYRLVLESFTRLVDVISAFEKVHVVASPEKREEAESWLGKRALIHTMDINDAWARDAAPTFIKSKESLTAVCWTFTGWGGRFSPFDKDAKVGASIAEAIGVSTLPVDFALEGGGVHSNGAGSLLTTDAVLFDPGRNIAQEKDQICADLQNILGAEKILSLPGAFDGDDTGGHVDVVAAFHPDGMILLNNCLEHRDPNYQSTAENRTYLKSGNQEVTLIPQPEAIFSGKDRLAHSYLNFYICNDALLLPAFGSSLDQRVQAQFRELFPNREIVLLEARPFYWGGGGIHCVTQQQPLL